MIQRYKITGTMATKLPNAPYDDVQQKADFQVEDQREKLCYQISKGQREYVLRRSTRHGLPNSRQPYYLETNQSLISVALMEFVMYSVPHEKYEIQDI
ncbi:hypothetical protein Trydic_g195 [Trypoxylus dichotomus]